MLLEHHEGVSVIEKDSMYPRDAFLTIELGMVSMLTATLTFGKILLLD